MDYIKIQNLELFANHGVFKEETALGQKFLMNLKLYTDLQPAGADDAISESLHYGEICHFVTKYFTETTYHLIEAAAQNLAIALLFRYPKLEEVEIELKKPWAPIGLPIETVSVVMKRGWTKAYLSIGSNIGDREGYIHQAIDLLKKCNRIKEIEVSRLIETKPYGNADQGDFLNGAIAIKTLFSPYELLDFLHSVENECGRKRELHWGPRTLDLDILFYGDETVRKTDLVIPHIDLQNRDFVLSPLVTIAPEQVHPVFKKTVYQLWERLQSQK